MVATVKIIPYAVAGGAVARGARRRRRRAPVRAFRPGRASLILTRTPGLKESLIAKGAEAVGRGWRRSGWSWRRR